MEQAIFTFRDIHGEVRHFDVAKLEASTREHPDAWELIDIPIDRGTMRMAIRDRGVDEKRARALPMSVLDTPGIACWMEDGSFLTVDGNHRMVKRVLRKMKTMQFYVATKPVWSQALTSLSPELEHAALQTLK